MNGTGNDRREGRRGPGPRGYALALRAGWALAALLAWTGCQGEIDPTPAEEAVRPPPPFEPAPAQLRRLTDAQYRNVVRDLFGEDVVLPPKLEPDVRVGGLQALGASSAGVSNRGTEQYETAAYQIAEQVLAEGEARDALMPCDPTGTVDGACAERFFRRVGRRAWRRPLTGDELASLVAVSNRAAEVLGDFHQGLQYGLAALLQAPDFIFRVEVGAEDGPRRAFTDWEMAERLAFFLWNTAPDDALLDAAAAGELSDEATLTAHVDRMLEDERARQGVRELFTQMLELDELDDLRKDPTVFVHMSADVGPSAREETLRLIEHLVFEADADYRELMTTRTTFLNRKLASIYGVPAPTREGFARYDFPEDSPRRGLLGHVSVLALQSHVSSSSATLRGAFIRQNLLCGAIPPPPANVDTSIPEPVAGAVTLRERVARHLEDPSCAGCHRLMDPLGLGLENFDALGLWRDTDNGAPIDASGELSGVYYETPVELADAIAADPDYVECLGLTAYRFATGHEETGGEEVVMRELQKTFAESGYRVKALLRAIALSEGFRFVGAPIMEEE
ncbi:MAG TPA: DUF1592 domain-containing protein [Polyangiaceae bacterium LLY-WYZ-15_(1-7)]|nr:hypothetical protein [Sandaracinus sp.]HJL00755.1 DUF1592 domain-containing protein [Polyangiaceae bacterium LLY-WYZ-15_(1-7)]MBJ72731.1 hypothetical protein [Sandaracinus sp.]HJL09116.1 DUF1592 domain-containing protein [Polyangiaceae bacterium LLY-WYZ-15_(1-7)]HJL28176.1 DUF1592 domain-containing protein [Polyangiaceae bacterium LLY-WYZ-15_(1-7)]